MNLTSGIIRTRYYLFNELNKLEEKIINLEKDLIEMNKNSEKYKKMSKYLEHLEENFRKEIYLYKFLSENSELKMIYIKKVISYLIDLEGISIVDLIECMCFMFNKNYEYYTNEENLKEYVETRIDMPKDLSTKNFYYNQQVHKILREYITEDNKITKMKELTFEELQKFKNVGFSNRAAAILIDTALRNYEYELIYSFGLNKIKKLNANV